MAVVVVFPFVPVTARYGTSASRRPELHLAPDGQAARPRPVEHRSPLGHAGTGHDQGRVVEVLGLVAAGQHLDAIGDQRIGGGQLGAGRGSLTRTAAPSAASTRAAARPATPAPTTTARSPAKRPVTRARPAR